MRIPSLLWYVLLQKIDLQVPNHFEEIQLTLIKIAAEIVGFKKVEFVKEGLAIALSHLSYYQMMNPEPPGIYQYIDIGETHCTIHNVFVKDVCIIHNHHS